MALKPVPPRVLFLGDSITYSGQYVEYFEAFVRLHFPEWHGEILDLGLPSETVSGLSEEGHAGGAFPRPNLHERLDRVLARTKPDLVIACYGMNDGIYLPPSEDRFGKFQSGIKLLHQKVVDRGADIIHLTPPTYEPGAGSAFNYNDVLDSYASWLLAQQSHGWKVVDVHGPMKLFLHERHQRDPAYHLAADGVHPGEMGHWLIAVPLLQFFGAPASYAKVDSAKQLFASEDEGLAILALVEQRQRLLKDAWLTDTGHQRPGMTKGLPLPDAVSKAAEVEQQIQAVLDRKFHR